MAAPPKPPATFSESKSPPPTQNLTDIRLKCLEIVTRHGFGPPGGFEGVVEKAALFEKYVTR